MEPATERVGGDGLHAAAAGGGAERLAAAGRGFHAENGYGGGSEQAGAVHALCPGPSLGLAWLFADARGRGVGYALAHWRHSVDHGGRVAVLDDLWIEPGLRGRGSGTQPLRVALAGMERAGARAVIAEADPADAAAMAFYRRLGFAPKGTALLVGALPGGR